MTASLILSLRVTLMALAVVAPAGAALGWWLARSRGPLRAQIGRAHV